VISFESCSTGDFSVEGHLAGQALYGNDHTLLVRANTGVTGIFDQFFLEEAQNLFALLGIGRSFMGCYPYVFSGDPPHFFGDPTIRLRLPELTGPRPKLVVRQKHHQGEFQEVVSFKQESVSGASVVEEVEIINQGDRNLVLGAPWSAIYLTVDGGIRLEYGGLPFLIQDFQGDHYTLTVAPGQSKIITFKFTPCLDSIHSGQGSLMLGTYRGKWPFVTNDPEIGAFMVDLSAVAR